MNTFYLFRYESEIASGRVDSLVIFNSKNDLSAEELDEVVQEELKRNLTPDRVLIVVRSNAYKSALGQFNNSAKLELTLDRLSRASVSIASFGSNGEEVDRLYLRGSSAQTDFKFEAFKRRACTSIFRERDGFVRSTPAFHFRNPSDRHTDQFIRLSNVLVTWPEISFWAFCTMPFIPSDAEVAYVDTPALFSLVNAMNDHWRAIGSQRHMSTDSFGSYAGLLKYKFTGANDAVVLISASSSGGLAKKISNRDPLLTGDRIVHIAFLGAKANRPNSVCDLSVDRKENPNGFEPTVGDYHSGSCPLCLAGSIAIPLEGEQFDIAGPQPDALLINADDGVKDLQKTMTLIAGSKILRVGLAPPHSPLPRQFDICPDAILQTDAIRKRIDYIIARSVPAHTNVIVSLDKGSYALAERIQHSLGSDHDAKVISVNQLRQVERTETLRPVVVAAAAIESGRSLLDVSRELRSSYPTSPQVYIIGIAKYTSNEKYGYLRSTIVRGSDIQPHEFRAAERLMLPPSSAQNVWTKELDLLEELINSKKISDLGDAEVVAELTRRKALLALTDQPLDDKLFLKSAWGAKLTLQHGFAFWPESLHSKVTSQADVYFTIASVLQALRSNAATPGARALRSGRLQQTLLDPANFGRFNDGVIQASLLRAAFPHELNYASSPELSSEMGRIIRRLIESSARPRGEAAPEFLLALAVRQLSLMREHLDNVLAPFPDGSPLVRALINICLHKTKSSSLPSDLATAALPNTA